MIHLLLPWPSRRDVSGVHLRRIFTGCRRVRLAHLILRNHCADGGARTGVSRPARMGLVGCGGAPKIAIREQGLFLVKRPGNRHFLSTLVASGAPRHGGDDSADEDQARFALTFSYAPHILVSVTP